MPNLRLDDETLRLLVDELERGHEARELRLVPDHEFQIRADSHQKSELVRRLEKYIDFEGGGLKILEVPLRGQPAKFLLCPDISQKGFGITLKFQYRF